MLRMYVDEVGNADLKASSEPNHRYLSLTGVVFALDYVDRVVAPQLEALKRKYFKRHVDEPPLIFHRKELLNKNYPSTVARRNGQDLPGDFGGQIAKILEEDKYRCSPQGRIEGWGRKWLP